MVAVSCAAQAEAPKEPLEDRAELFGPTVSFARRPSRALPINLPNLPAHGFAVGFRRGVLFVSLEGRIAARLPGHLLQRSLTRRDVWTQHGRSHFRLDLAARLMDPVAEASVLTSEGEYPQLPAPHGTRYKGMVVGHWRFSFGRDSVRLAQWSGECEAPTAYWIEGGTQTIVTGEGSIGQAPESIALGWMPDGTAAVYLGEGACGGRGDPPGIYLFSGPGEGTLLFETPRYASVEMW